MYISNRSAQVRNMALALVNGAITLIILLIAPLGLAAVLINTILVMLTTYVTATIGDRVLRYLQSDTPMRAELMTPTDRSRASGQIVRRSVEADELEHQ